MRRLTRTASWLRRLQALAPAPDHLTMNACRSAGFEPDIAFQSRDPLAIAALVRAGLCVTIIPRRLSPHFSDLALIDVAPRPLRRAIYATLPPAGTSALTETLLHALERAAR